jgi:thiol-disulfide isomerase/thioredoxin
MLIIILGGQSLLSKSRFLLSHTAAIQRLFGVVMVLTSIGLFFNVDRRFQSFILDRFPNYGLGLTSLETNSAVQAELSALNGPQPLPGTLGQPMSDMINPQDFGPAPELIPGGEWFNSSPLTLAGLRGKVVLVDFWTYTCINCIRTLPYLSSWHTKYSDSGLVIIGVHTPEFEFEKSASNLRSAISDYAIPYPVVQDNAYATWHAFHNSYWPAKYLIDAKGIIRYTHFGEGKYDQTEAFIQKLLAESGTPPTHPIANAQSENYARTPELYVGSNRFSANSMRFTGDWIDQGEFREAYQGSTLTLDFQAKEVFLVMRPGTPATPRIRVLLDGSPVQSDQAGSDTKQNSEFLLHDDRLYHLISLPVPGSHSLTIEFLTHPVEVFAFTFG